MKLYFRSLAALSIGLCLANTAVAGQPAPTVGITLGMDKLAYTQTDHSIQAMMTLFNNAKTPLVFIQHGRQFEWQILDAQGNVVWDYAKGRMFPHNVIRRSLAQGHLDYAYQVPLTTQDGQPLPPGNYTLRGQLDISPSMGGEIGFTITSPTKSG